MEGFYFTYVLRSEKDKGRFNSPTPLHPKYLRQYFGIGQGDLPRHNKGENT